MRYYEGWKEAQREEIRREDSRIHGIPRSKTVAIYDCGDWCAVARERLSAEPVISTQFVNQGQF